MKDVMFVETAKTAIAEEGVPVHSGAGPRRNTAALVALKRAAIEGMVYP